MKKLLIFFSTLFVFLIPHVNAENEIPLYIDYRTPGVTPYIPDSINAIKSTSCTTYLCNQLSSSLGHTPTIYEYVENEIKQMNDAGEYYMVFANFTNDIFGVSSSDAPSFTFVLFNKDKIDLDTFVLNSRLSYNYYYFNLYNNGSKNIYAWSSSSPSYSSALSNKETLGNDYTTQLPSLFTFDGNNNYDLVSSILYYTNIEFTYGFDYPITVFHDWFSTASSDSSVSINTGMGTATNKYLMLRSFIEEDNFFPPEDPEPTPDNPNQGIEDGLGDINDSINSSDISGSEGAFNDFFGNFESDNHGLFAIVSTPLNFIKSFLNSVCTPLVLPFPFVSQDVTLPCMEYVYSEFFGNFFSAYQTITTGIVAYWVCVNIMRIVKDMKDSEKDTIEVLDL